MKVAGPGDEGKTQAPERWVPRRVRGAAASKTSSTQQSPVPVITNSGDEAEHPADQPAAPACASAVDVAGGQPADDAAGQLVVPWRATPLHEQQ